MRSIKQMLKQTRLELNRNSKSVSKRRRIGSPRNLMMKYLKYKELLKNQEVQSQQQNDHAYQ